MLSIRNHSSFVLESTMFLVLPYKSPPVAICSRSVWCIWAVEANGHSFGTHFSASLAFVRMVDSPNVTQQWHACTQHNGQVLTLLI